MIGGGATGAGVAWDRATRLRRHPGRSPGLAEDERPLPRAVAFGWRCGQGPPAAREVHRREPHPAPVAADCIEDTGGLFVRPRPGTTRLRRPASRRAARHRRRLRGDPRRRHARARATPKPEDLARVQGAQHQHRRVEDGVGDGSRVQQRGGRILPTTPSPPSIARATRSPAPVCATRAPARRSTSTRA